MGLGLMGRRTKSDKERWSRLLLLTQLEHVGFDYSCQRAWWLLPTAASTKLKSGSMGIHYSRHRGEEFGKVDAVQLSAKHLGHISACR